MLLLNRKFGIRLLLPGLILVATGCEDLQPSHPGSIASGLKFENSYTLSGEKDLYRDYPAIDSEGLLNVVIEIPAGTIEKWEVNKKTGNLEWVFVDGQPRYVSYLGYPGNYGLIPRTLLPKNEDGDGDALDVLVLGPVEPRGAVVRARLIGILKMLDQGEQDHKLIAVTPRSPFDPVQSLGELEERFKGSLKILENWFSNYKGPGKVQITGHGERQEADQVLQAAMKAYSEHAANRYR